MIVKLLLDRKREGGELAPEEIRALIGAYTRGDVPDYQMAAFAMAVCCRGMTAAETHALTDAMQHGRQALDGRHRRQALARDPAARRVVRAVRAVPRGAGTRPHGGHGGQA